MSLLEKTLFGIRDKVQTAIDRIKSFEPPEGYFVAYSGGKDSDVVLDLVKPNAPRVIKRLARWVNKKWFFTACERFENFRDDYTK